MSVAKAGPACEWAKKFFMIFLPKRLKVQMAESGVYPEAKASKVEQV